MLYALQCCILTWGHFNNTYTSEATVFVIGNGNRTEWSPIRSVIIRVINKIGRPRSGSPISLITSMITDRIGRHEVLLLINLSIITLMIIENRAL